MIFIKTIGVIIRNFEEQGISFTGSRSDLFNWINQFNVNIIAIPIYIDFPKLKEAISKCDGVILSGGEAFHTNDFKLIEYLYHNDIPTLGICLGMQSIAEYFNNKLEIEVNNHYSHDKYVHKVILDKRSLLYKIIYKEEILVNSRHHTAIPCTSLKVNAISEDDVIEGIEDTSKKFFLGIQWHPETLNNENSNLILEYFINTL